MQILHYINFIIQFWFLFYLLSLHSQFLSSTMAEKSLVLVYYIACIATIDDSVIFFSDNQSCFYVKNDNFIKYLKIIIEENIKAVDSERVWRITYKLPVSSCHYKIYYRSFKLCYFFPNPSSSICKFKARILGFLSSKSWFFFLISL